jgi:hypothetical protein
VRNGERGVLAAATGVLSTDLPNRGDHIDGVVLGEEAGARDEVGSTWRSPAAPSSREHCRPLLLTRACTTTAAGWRRCATVERGAPPQGPPAAEPGREGRRAVGRSERGTAPAIWIGNGRDRREKTKV